MNSIYKQIIIISLGCYLIAGCQIFSKATFRKPKFNPNFNYMRIVINDKKESWIISSFEDNWPKNRSSVWYSKDLGIIRLNNGRLISYSTVHPKYHWMEESKTEINWQKVASGHAQTVKRCVTNLINNHIDFCDNNTIIRTINKPRNLGYIGSENLIWIREYSEQNNEPWREIWYGLNRNNHQPVFGYMCLNKDNCLSWQLWK